jgi:hypothetical protein
VPRRALFLLLAFALLSAQTLGMMHRIVHGPQVEVGHATAEAHADGAEGDHDHAHGWLAALFSGHADGDEGCRLLAAMGHDGLLLSHPAAGIALAPAFLLKILHGDFVARWAALFDARGPPPAIL